MKKSSILFVMVPCDGWDIEMEEFNNRNFSTISEFDEEFEGRFGKVNTDLYTPKDICETHNMEGLAGNMIYISIEQEY